MGATSIYPANDPTRPLRLIGSVLVVAAGLAVFISTVVTGDDGDSIFDSDASWPKLVLFFALFAMGAGVASLISNASPTANPTVRAVWTTTGAVAAGLSSGNLWGLLDREFASGYQNWQAISGVLGLAAAIALVLGARGLGTPPPASFAPSHLVIEPDASTVRAPSWGPLTVSPIECDCGGFRGDVDALYCGACGHARGVHAGVLNQSSDSASMAVGPSAPSTASSVVRGGDRRRRFLICGGVIAVLLVVVIAVVASSGGSDAQEQYYDRQNLEAECGGWWNTISESANSPLNARTRYEIGQAIGAPEQCIEDFYH